jgi:hypothetical protein
MKTQPLRKQHGIARWIAAHAPTLVALCSMVIALCSLELSIHQAQLARQHDYLATKPRLQISFYYTKEGVGWTLSNDGLGPARIRGFRATVNGIRQTPTEHFPDILKSFGLPQGTEAEFLNPVVGAIVEAGKSNKILWVQSGAGANIVNARHNQVVFDLCYCSMYEQCWTFSSRGWNLEGTRNDTCSLFKDEPQSIWWRG